ncbi:type-F conjugative transfer system secretin TraK [Novosphingobium sp. ZW T3_23]|uniref:type-F conjugative transfer system secretin TraK n=1 Tax=Novosphingobium sp. ZW T3_23 TaxID=3378084 RepID=UPI00385227F4
MPTSAKARLLAILLAPLTPVFSAEAQAQSAAISAFPEQTSHIRLSNRDVNHLVCTGGEIEDVRFSAEKGLAVERGGADAWIKFLVLETEDMGLKTRTYVTAPSEFFVTCNGAVYPLYAEPSDIPAQTVNLLPGQAQRARSNEALLAPLVEEERAVGIALAVLQDRIPASFSEAAPARQPILLENLPQLSLAERRRLEIEGTGLSISEYLVTAAAPSPTPITLDERDFLDVALGADIFSVTLDRLTLGAGADAGPGVGDAARLVVVRRSRQP